MYCWLHTENKLLILRMWFRFTEATNFPCSLTFRLTSQKSERTINFPALARQFFNRYLFFVVETKCRKRVNRETSPTFVSVISCHIWSFQNGKKPPEIAIIQKNVRRIDFFRLDLGQALYWYNRNRPKNAKATQTGLFSLEFRFRPQSSIVLCTLGTVKEKRERKKERASERVPSLPP